MGLVFLFGLVLLVIICVLFIFTGTIEYKIEKLVFSNANKEIKVEFLSYLEIYIFSQIRIFRLKIDKNRIKKIQLKDKIKKVNLEKLKIDKNLRKESIDAIKKLKIELKRFCLDLKIGTKNVVISSSLVMLLSSIISLILARKIKKFSKENYFFCIKPIYIGENILEVKFNSIVSIKIVNIIYIIYRYLKEKGEWRKNERASNRGSYGYSYEQY